MANSIPTCILISDFTIDPLADLLLKPGPTTRVGPYLAPFNQVEQVLRDSKAPCWNRSRTLL